AVGAQPVFVDVLPGKATMDPAALARAVDANPDVKTVIVVHLYGRLAEVEAIDALCRVRGLPWIEDCAQAHGACAADGRRAGSIGTIAAFSFYPTKNLGALGDGGAITTGDQALAERVRSLRQY